MTQKIHGVVQDTQDFDDLALRRAPDAEHDGVAVRLRFACFPPIA